VVVVTYVPASSAKRKRKAFSNDPKGGKGRPFLLTCAGKWIENMTVFWTAKGQAAFN
jgi:hypothetical protein